MGGGTASLIVSKMSISPIVGLFRRVCADADAAAYTRKFGTVGHVSTKVRRRTHASQVTAHSGGRKQATTVDEESSAVKASKARRNGRRAG